MEEDRIFLEIFISLIFLANAFYALYVGISFLRGNNLKNTNLYKVSEMLFKKIQNKDKLEKIESDLENPENFKKKGILFLFFSIVSFILILVVLFG